jgi:hypothetical protein
MTQEHVDAIGEALRELHPELRRPLTWHAVQRVLRRARISYQRVPLDVPAMLISHAGVSVILLNSELPARSHLEAMTHEFAHIHLHTDPNEAAYHQWRPDVDDVREVEADYLARCLIAGPDDPVPYLIMKPAVRPAARPVAPPRQLPAWFFDPYADDYKLGVSARDPGPDVQPAPSRRPRIARPAARFSKTSIEQPKVFFDKLFGPLRYRDGEGRKWDMRDVSVDLIDGAIKRVPVSLGSERAIYRWFLGTNGERRRYRFAKWESREVVARRLTMQLRESTLMPAREQRAEERAG